MLHKERIVPAELAKLRLFRGECPEGLHWMLERAEVLVLQAGEVLLEPGQSNLTLYILLEGALRIELTANEQLTVSRIDPGECVGELSLLDGHPTSARVVAESDCRVLAIDSEVLWTLIRRSQAVARNLLQLLAGRIRHNDMTLSDFYRRQQQYAHNARVDPLTGLYNRYWLDELLPRLLERSDQDGGTLGLVMLDVDHFKNYNDTHGHLAGDAVLRALGQLLLQALRPGDAAIRYGGEEFVVLLPETPAAVLWLVAERLRSEIERGLSQRLAEQGLPGATASVGVALHHPGETRQALFAAADAALYRAKRGGRNRVVMRHGDGNVH